MKKTAGQAKDWVRVSPLGLGPAPPSERLPPGDTHPGAAEFGHRDLPAALGGPHHGVGDGQPEARSRYRITRPVEAIEHRIPLVLGDPGTGVVDAELHAAPDTTDAHLDPAAVSGELARVVDEDTGQPGRSGRHSPAR